MRQIFLSSKKQQSKQSQQSIIIKHDQQLQNIQNEVIYQHIYQDYPFQQVINYLEGGNLIQYVLNQGGQAYVNFIISMRLHINNYKSYLLNSLKQISPAQQFINQLQNILSKEILEHIFGQQMQLANQSKNDIWQEQHLNQSPEEIQSQIKVIYEIFYYLILCSSQLTQYLQGSDELFCYIEPQLSFLICYVLNAYQGMTSYQQVTDNCLLKQLNACVSKILGFYYNTIEAKKLQVGFLDNILPQILQLPYLIHIPRVLLYFYHIIKSTEIQIDSVPSHDISYIQLQKFFLANFLIQWSIVTNLAQCTNISISDKNMENLVLERLQQQTELISKFDAISNIIIEMTEDSLYELLDYVNTIGLLLIKDEYDTGNSDVISSQSSFENDEQQNQYKSNNQISPHPNYEQVDQKINHYISQLIQSIMQNMLQRILQGNRQNALLTQLCMQGQNEIIIHVATSMVLEIEFAIIANLVKKYQRLRDHLLSLVLRYCYDALLFQFDKINDTPSEEQVHTIDLGQQKDQNIIQIQNSYLRELVSVNTLISVLNVIDLCISCNPQDPQVFVLMGYLANKLQQYNSSLYDNDAGIMSPKSPQFGFYELQDYLTNDPLKQKFIEIFLSNKCSEYVHLIYQNALKKCNINENNHKPRGELNDIFNGACQIIDFLISQRVSYDLFIGQKNQCFTIEHLMSSLNFIDNENLQAFTLMIGIFYNVYQGNNQIKSLAQQFIQRVQQLQNELQIQEEEATELVHQVVWILDE